ncbi:MAG: phosphoenolpyruvate synthase [Zetaproteobacteria bacterium]|nr:phosphoenolpyruvate synthase [Zetaproteobacteria bacterium]
MHDHDQYIRFLDTLTMDDLASVGGKNASLGEMITTLSGQGISVPRGFATTAEGYWHFMRHNQLLESIEQQLTSIDHHDIVQLSRIGKTIRKQILTGEIPDDFKREILNAYQTLATDDNIAVAIRSSATAEDLPNASFAGQQESYLYIQGEAALLQHIRLVFASLFNDRAISYRIDQGFGHNIALSACVQKMVRSDLACSGVMFTLDTESGCSDIILINGAYGLGEMVVQGAVSPDEFYLFKPSLNSGNDPLIRKQLGEKALEMVKGIGDKPTQIQAVSPLRQQQFCLNINEINTLAKQAMTIEAHYSARAGHWQPMDIEWAKDGITGELFIVQARPETIHSQQQHQQRTLYHLDATGEPLIRGKSIGQKIASGNIRVIEHVDEMKLFQAGEILVTDMTDPDWEPIMKIASAIVTNRGGRTCHAAIIARELGVPAIVGTKVVTSRVKSGQQATLSCAEGDIGTLYQGLLPFHSQQLEIQSIPRPDTKIMLNIAQPDTALTTAQLPNDGVGLTRLEFIINNHIGIHPLALLHPEQCSPDIQEIITQKSRAFSSPRDFFIQTLCEGVSTIAAAFYPKKVIVRLSDFKSNEYRHLTGGEAFEPIEDNAMIGFRGASRYRSTMFHDAFAMECEALRLARKQKGFTNIHLMIPFTRTPHEGQEVLTRMEGFGLKRGVDSLKVYVMCEIPANVILADQFLDLFDGFSIGSNDLTQLILGVDRNSEWVEDLFDERNEAVRIMLQQAIIACKARGKYIGICGQGPSDHADFAQWLVTQGIESISLNADTILATTASILAIERQLKEKHG